MGFLHQDKERQSNGTPLVRANDRLGIPTTTFRRLRRAAFLPGTNYLFLTPQTKDSRFVNGPAKWIQNRGVENR
jgi:hypothetical protein